MRNQVLFLHMFMFMDVFNIFISISEVAGNNSNNTKCFNSKVFFQDKLSALPLLLVFFPFLTPLNLMWKSFSASFLTKSLFVCYFKFHLIRFSILFFHSLLLSLNATYSPVYYFQQFHWMCCLLLLLLLFFSLVPYNSFKFLPKFWCWKSCNLTWRFTYIGELLIANNKHITNTPPLLFYGGIIGSNRTRHCSKWSRRPIKFIVFIIRNIDFLFSLVKTYLKWNML